MINNAMGILIASDSEVHMNELTIQRTSASLPFGGRYRMIDFALSNLVNSGISTIGIVTRNNYNSLMDHLRMGRDWDLNRKNSGLTLFPPFAFNTLRDVFKGKVDAIYSLKGYIMSQKKIDYVVLANTNIICNIDMEEVINEHIERGADITMLTTRTDEINPRKQVVTVDADGRVTDMRFAVIASKTKELVNTQVYVIDKNLLLSLVENAYARGFADFEKDVLIKQVGELKIFAREITSYAAVIDDIPGYYKHSMALLDADTRKDLFYGKGTIFTKVKDSVPVRYMSGAKVKNSLIADGCVIDGTVENSILFRGVHIEKGAVVKNSIIMEKGTIGERASVVCTITDKNVVIQPERRLAGYDSYPIVIVKNKIV